MLIKNLSVILILLLTLPNIVLAQEWLIEKIFGSLFKIPSNFLEFPNIIYFVFIPFIGNFTIIYAILTKLEIFENKFNVVIALVFTVSLMYFINFFAIMEYIYSYSSGAIIIIFALLLLVAVGFWTWRTFGRIREGE